MIGNIVDGYGYDIAWLTVGILGALTIVLAAVLNLADRRQFGLLYSERS